MVSDDLHEDDIFRLLLYSSMPFAIWVTWDAGNSLPDPFASNIT